jgi:hypothetical protein
MGEQDALGCLQHSLNVLPGKDCHRKIRCRCFLLLHAGILHRRRTNIDLGGEEIWPLSLQRTMVGIPINLGYQLLRAKVLPSHPFKWPRLLRQLPTGQNDEAACGKKPLLTMAKPYETEPQF